MRSRLFDSGDLVVRALLALSFFACGGSQFSAGAGGSPNGPNGGSADGESGGAGATDSGASAGESGAADGGTTSGGTTFGGAGGSANGGASGGTSAAGTGGKAPPTCDCAADSYCQDGAIKCRLCSDFSRFEFAAPEKLATLSQTPSGNERFPRAGSTGTDLFYRSGPAESQRIWYAATPVSGVGKALSAAGLDESAPVFSPIPSGSMAVGPLAQNFFFDRQEGMTNLRHLMMATWSGSALSTAVRAPAPLNGVGSDFSIAVARDVSRAYWMSAHVGQVTADLVFASMLDGAASTPSVLDLKVQTGAATCDRLGDDATPWVNAAGTLLLFRSESVDENCAVIDSGAFDLFAAPLSKDTGLPNAAAVPLSALNNTGGNSTETDPSLSQNSCVIYFASDNGGKDFDLYRAARD